MHLFLPMWDETEQQLQSKNISEIFRIVPISHFNTPKNIKNTFKLSSCTETSEATHRLKIKEYPVLQGFQTTVLISTFFFVSIWSFYDDASRIKMNIKNLEPNANRPNFIS